MQAHAVGTDVEVAIQRSGLKATYTPCQMLIARSRENQLGTAGVKQSLNDISRLPDAELSRAFVLFLSLLTVADGRRRQKELDPERHWWHRDLSDEKVVAELLNENSVNN